MIRPPDILPVLLCGGSGSRLWPTSRELYPKQLLPLGTDDPLVIETARRVDGAGFLPPLIICNDEHRFLIAASFQEAGLGCSDIVLEPMGRNTAAAACVAAHYAASLATDDTPSPIVVLLPADHLIADVTQFCADLGTAAMAAAQTGRLVTFGVQPDRPETGYGYIQAGDLLGDSDVRAVARFVEKPDTATAKDYLASGDYLWNSGIFAYSAGAFLAEAEQLVPDIVSATRAAFEMAKRDLDFLRLDKEEFARAPAESIDYAVMEKTQNAAILPVSFGWSDIGSWEALWTESPRDESDNVLVGDVISHDTRGSYIRNDSDAVTAVVGLNDIVVVTTDDAVLVCDRSRSQDVKIIVEGLKRDKRIEWEAHRTVYRPWGSFKSLAIGANYQVKEIVVNPGAALSLQYHNQRAEHWVVVEGTAEVRRGDETLELSENQSIFIDVGQIHRVRNPGEGPVKLIEVQSGDYLGEDDIVRLADDYARADT